ncbi:MAG TPA: RDD family protein, partial [Candidatus Angelobacter sp.]|nr:RDD family protein [Candidatus Angelobacter sp.]
MLSHAAEVARIAENQSATELAWRQEVVSRVQQHRVRRGRPTDPRALKLDFSSDTPHSFGALASDTAMPPPPQRFAEILVERNLAQEEYVRPEPKIIRFPRTQAAYIPTVEEVTLEELERAVPVPESPRILEAAEEEVFEPQLSESHAFEAEVSEQETYEAESFERNPVESYPSYPKTISLKGQQLDMLSSFADIHLEPEETRIAHELEVIPRPAPLPQRLVSGLVDAGIVFIATGLFVLTFMEAAEEMPQSRMTLVCMVAAGLIFWLLFQYLFLTFQRATPGMNMAQLELCTFAGAATCPMEQQRRALASTLSVCAIGLGFAWALVDEDRLGWHDRISGTHMRM